MIPNQLETYIEKIPKAELHIHLEGSIEPATQLKLAEKNKVKIKYNTIEEIRDAYKFKDLNDFLNIYNMGTKVLRSEEDFYLITMEYLAKAYSQNIVHTEIFIDFQTYERRNIVPEIIMNGAKAAIKEANEKYNITTYLILAFLRHLGAKSAMRTLKKGIEFKDDIIGIGLAASEIGNPPELFKDVFEVARANGFRTTAHAGEEGPASYVKSSLEILKVDRIDHGNRAMDDPQLIQELIDRKIPLTLCPLSNIALGNVVNMKEHTLKKKLDLGMMVSVNSDDPAYFGGYVNENFKEVTKELGLDKEDIRKLSANSVISSFLPENDKTKLLKDIELFDKQY
ncbi:MAG: adenosine deaminase [Saprospiraceae bacterium]